MQDIKIGIGYDIHRFVNDRKLYLCGVEIPYPFGLWGHSDADVALHAIIDAILGAVGAGDIGSWFPDYDPAYQNIDSKELLKKVMQSPQLEGWRVGNLDVIIITQQPQILPYATLMKRSLAGLLNCDVSRISIKGKTNEKLDSIGRAEGMAAQAAVLMVLD